MARPTAAGRAAAGRAVRAWRADETQQAVAARAGIDTDTLGNLEAGNKWPWNRTLRAIEDALGQPRGELDRIAAEADAPDGSPPPAPAPMSERLRRLIREELGDERAARLIAHDEHLASGRIPSARDAGPQGSDRKGRRSAG